MSSPLFSLQQFDEVMQKMFETIKHNGKKIENAWWLGGSAALSEMRSSLLKKLEEDPIVPKHYCSIESYNKITTCVFAATSSCSEKADGTLWVTAEKGPNGYDCNPNNQVNFCPFCGYKATTPIKINSSDPDLTNQQKT